MYLIEKRSSGKSPTDRGIRSGPGGFFERVPTPEKINSANYAARISVLGEVTASTIRPDVPLRVRALNDTERRLHSITVGYPSARVTFQTSHERSRDIPRGPGTFVPIWRRIIPESGQTNRPFPRSVPLVASDVGFRVCITPGDRLIIVPLIAVIITARRTTWTGWI